MGTQAVRSRGEIALLEEVVLPLLVGVLKRVEEIDARVRRHRRPIQAEG
ncbi:MAG: hypothetical protein ACK41W_08335 [Cyanobacteriota bacterium]